MQHMGTTHQLEILYQGYQSSRMSTETYLNAVKEVIGYHFKTDTLGEETLKLLTVDPITPIETTRGY